MSLGTALLGGTGTVGVLTDILVCEFASKLDFFRDLHWNRGQTLTVVISETTSEVAACT